MVGDEDSRSTRFRGADIRNILDFEEDFPDAAGRQARAELPLDADDPRRRERGDPPQPRAASTRRCGPSSGRATRSRSASSTTSTPRRGSSSGEIERLVDEGVSRAEIAVFYRTNAQSRVLEDTLLRREIGYQVIGGPKFYERAEIKDAIAYLTVLGNPAGRHLVQAHRQLAAPAASARRRCHA